MKGLSSNVLKTTIEGIYRILFKIPLYILFVYYSYTIYILFNSIRKLRILLRIL